MATILADGYWEQLKHIQNNQAREISKITTPPSGFFKIDLDERSITPPAEYRDFLAVEQEHMAETIYFEVDRFFDDVDLTTTNIIIEYVNGKGDARIFPAVLQDWTTNPGHIRFAWVLGNEATKTVGILKFAVRFYSVDQQEKIFTYSLQTRPYEGRVIASLQDPAGKPIDAFADYDYSADVLAGLTQQIGETRMRWINL